MYWSQDLMNGQAERPEEEIKQQPVADEASEAEIDTGEQVEDADADAEAEAEAEVSELEQAQAKAKENWDRYLRTAAELENVRKRAARDVENAHRFALERFSKQLRAVRDSLEMGLAAADSASVESLLQGSEATLKILGTTMQQFGIEEVDPAGEPFDPEFHEAISMQPSDDVEPGSVATVVQKGYSLNGRLLRPAMVIVASD
jgi:molecular chaperone GrpE